MAFDAKLVILVYKTTIYLIRCPLRVDHGWNMMDEITERQGSGLVITDIRRCGKYFRLCWQLEDEKVRAF